MNRFFPTSYTSIFLAIFYIACSAPKNIFHKSSSVSNHTSSATEKKTGEVDLDTITAGDGITVGNGQNDTEKVSKEAKGGSFLLACIQKYANHFSCEVSKNTVSLEDEIKNLKIYDKDGQLIPANDLLFRVIESEGLVYLEIFIQSDAVVTEILGHEIIVANSEEENKENSDGGIPQAADSGEEPVNTSENNPSNCDSIGTPGTWILIPGNSDYGTSDFCVMKYEAKCGQANGEECDPNLHSPISIAENTPWVNISQQNASTECASLGSGFHLLTNAEYMTIAANIAEVASNWSGGTIGNALLNRGHSDDNPSQACPASNDNALNVVEGDCINRPSGSDEFIEQRTHTLNNGEVIWDLAGNAWELTSYVNSADKPTPLGRNWYEYSQPVVGTSTMSLNELVPQIAIINGWNSSKGIGMYNPGDNGVDGTLTRGGRWSSGAESGVFTADLNALPTDTWSTTSFRCSAPMP